MKKMVCSGGCKKGDCNGDCKRRSTTISQIDNEPIRKFAAVGELITKTRKKNLMSKKELSRSIGIKRSQISKIENNLEIARFDSIIKVFKALDAKIDLTIELPTETLELRQGSLKSKS
jgi:ribosome-binding protein aMBF1 (putative translation factor)